MTAAKWSWCFAHPEMFVVPIEAITRSGLNGAFVAELQGVRGVGSAWLGVLQQALRNYRERADLLHQRLPRNWLPARSQHLCVVARGHAVRPYFQPIRHASWLVYEEDFDPTFSSVEFATYLLFHMERMGWRGEVLAAFVENLPYWMLRDEEEMADFAAGAARSIRPDAAAFRALAKAIEWLRTAFHPTLRPTSLVVPSRVVPLGTSGLFVLSEHRSEWERVQVEWIQAAESAVQGHYAKCAQRTSEAGRRLCRYLAQRVPNVVLLAQGRDVVWQPEHGQDTIRVRVVVGAIAPPVARSLVADWEVIHCHSERFLRAANARLAEAEHGLDDSGLCFLWPRGPRIAYRLLEPGMDRLRLPAPPYERLMLGARTMHEWGHAAAVAGWVGVPARRRAEWEQECERLVEQCDRLVRDAPAPARHTLTAEIERLAQSGSPGRALAGVALGRMPDYSANLVARAFLSPLELETYVRNNVTCLLQVMRPEALFQRLVRYAYEFQYLALLGLDHAWEYLVDSTWFAREFLASRVVSVRACEELFATVGRLCALHEIDETKLALPAPLTQPPVSTEADDLC